jgi:hypothetical protein
VLRIVPRRRSTKSQTIYWSNYRASQTYLGFVCTTKKINNILSNVFFIFKILSKVLYPVQSFCPKILSKLYVVQSSVLSLERVQCFETGFVLSFESVLSVVVLLSFPSKPLRRHKVPLQSTVAESAPWPSRQEAAHKRPNLQQWKTSCLTLRTRSCREASS